MTRDPWRYRCPECGSVSVRKRRHLHDAREVREDHRHRTENTTDKEWFCDHCSTPFGQPDDAKVKE